MTRTKRRLIIFILFPLIFSKCHRKDNFQTLTGDYLGQTPPGDKPEIFAPGIISHGFHEHHLTISPGGKYFFFARNSPAEPFSFQGGSFDELTQRLKGPENGYGCLYWVDAAFIRELKPDPLQ